MDDVAEKILKIQEEVSESLQSSIDSVGQLREEEMTRLFEVRSRREEIQQELQDVIVAVDRAEREYRRSRQQLLDATRSGDEALEKESYEKAAHLMKVRGTFEERERMLSRTRDDLAREERRIEKLIAMSEEMANRFRLALNLMSTSIEQFMGDYSGQTMMTAALRIAEQESLSLARDLHDGLAQRIASSCLVTDLVRQHVDAEQYPNLGKELDHLKEELRETESDVRSFLFRLNPSGLREGFHGALARLASQVEQMTGAKLRFAVEGKENILSDLLRVNVFRIIHQAVVNAVKNGKAREVRLALSVGVEALRARISDDGLGFDVEQARREAESRGSYGLRTMEERARIAGGTLSVASSSGRGTVVSLVIPLRDTPKDGLD
jgi:two-component system sensor histidine kinase DegS